MQSPPNLLETEVYNISGLEIGKPEAEVLLLMGQPSKAMNVTLAGDYVDYIYEGLTVSLFANGMNLDSPKVVSSIYASDKEHCFNAVVCPGDSLESIKAKLGNSEILPAQNQKSARLYYLLPNLETCWLWIFTEDFKISSEVSIACQP